MARAPRQAPTSTAAMANSIRCLRAQLTLACVRKPEQSRRRRNLRQPPAAAEERKDLTGRVARHRPLPFSRPRAVAEW